MKTKTLYVLLALLVVVAICCLQGNAQEKTTKVNSKIDEMPEYPGKNKALVKDLKSFCKYPEEALKKELTGKVYVSFVVPQTGKIQNTSIAKGVGPVLDKEALQAVNQLNKIWKPGVKDGKVVDVTICILFEFKEDAIIDISLPEQKK